MCPTTCLLTGCVPCVINTAPRAAHLVGLQQKNLAITCLLKQCLSDFRGHMSHLGILFKWGPGICTSNPLPGDADAPGPGTMLLVAGY